MFRDSAYQRRDAMSLTKKTALALGFAILIGLMAQLRFPLPWTPVPITGQTFSVLLAGILLGSWWGGVSLALYIGLGVAGLPWFTGWSGGISHLAGPTGGYLIGFILAALFIWSFTSKFLKSRSFLRLLGLMLFANFVLIYVPGLLQLNLWLNLVSGSATSVAQTLTMGLLPFIAGDVVKVVAAALAARGLLPRVAGNTDMERSK
jgi:biotin transport system substrate-specific component